MAGQHIPRAQQTGQAVVGTGIAQCVVHLHGVDVAGQPGQRGRAVPVVHHALVATPGLKPGTGETIQLAQQTGLGEARTDHRTHLLRHRNAHVLRHVEAPVVDTLGQPMLHYAVGLAVHGIAHRRVGQVQFRHAGEVLPAGVAAIGLPREPVALGRITCLRRQKPRVPVGHMVQHRVQRQAHAAGVQCVGQPLERGLAPKHGVYAQEIGGVILVVAGGCKDGREVDAGHTQIGQVIQLVGNAIQVASKKLLAPGLVQGALVPVALGDPRQVVGRVGQFLCTAEPATNGKALGENLVDHLAGGVAGKGVKR